VSPSPSLPPHCSEAEQIVLLTKELAWSRLKIQALEERLRLELIRKYGPKSEKLSDNQLHLLDLEPGVSTEEVEAESRRDPLPSAPPFDNSGKKQKRKASGTPGTSGASAASGTYYRLHAGTMRLQRLRQR